MTAKDIPSDSGHAPGGDTLVQSPEQQESSRALSTGKTDDAWHRPQVQIPGYELQRPLRAGAYGQVWVALHRNTGQRVAVKFYTHRGGLDWSLLSREVEKLRLLSTDRYIVQLFEVGWEADPPYYVMEYFERGSLEDRLKTARMTVAEAVTLFHELALGLSQAHDKGILHCDLKPANVLLDAAGKPRLADFGQARLSSELEPALGTLFYMAPEQADLRATPDAQWDVYALGALLYCMLVGHPPHHTSDAEEQIRGSAALEEQLERYRAILRGSPRAKEHRRVTGVDAALAEIIDRCLAIQPRRRYPNVQAVLTALEERTLRHARRPLLVLGAVGPALLLVVMTWFSWNAFGSAVSQSEGAVVHRALESNRFAAQFVAETVVRQIEHRWEVLREQAERPELKSLLATASASAAAGQRPEPAVQQALQGVVERFPLRYPDVGATSWFVNDRSGVQLARFPHDEKTINRRYAYRDYFHGLGRELPRDTTQVEPIRRAYRSTVFESQATGRPMVAFSAPVWSGEPEESEVVGIIAMTVELGRFAELRADSGPTAEQVAMLIDTHPDWNQRAGLMLEHPALTAAANQADGTLRSTYVDPEVVEQLRALFPLRRELVAERTSASSADDVVAPRAADVALPTDTASAALVADHTSPVGAEAVAAENPAPLALHSGEAEVLTAALAEGVLLRRFNDPLRPEVGPSLAAAELVWLEGQAWDDGWVVIVAEPLRATVSPVVRLSEQLLQKGRVALGVVCLVITGLWGFVLIALNESPRWRVLAWLRRRAGLPTGSMSARATSSSRPPRVDPKSTTVWPDSRSPRT